MNRTKKTILDSSAVARMAVDAASEKQASDILLLDVRLLCGFADYFVICSAESERQMNAVADEIEKALSKQKVRVYRSEGTPSSGWMLMDLGDVIVHVFSPDQRAYYKLEDFWGKGVPVLRMQ